MKCNICPLFNYSCGENGLEESCSLFGDGWDSPFQYEDKHGMVLGCYVEKVYIMKVDRQIDEMRKQMHEAYLAGIDPQEESPEVADIDLRNI